MAIKPAQRNALSPVPPFGALPEAVVGRELEKWLPQILDVVYKDRNDTRSDVVVATGVSTPILILPSSRGIWLVAVNIGPVGDAVNFQAAALIATDGNSARILQVWNAPAQTLTLAGLTVSSTQSSGGSQNMNATAIQLTHF